MSASQSAKLAPPAVQPTTPILNQTGSTKYISNSSFAPGQSNYNVNTYTSYPQPVNNYQVQTPAPVVGQYSLTMQAPIKPVSVTPINTGINSFNSSSVITSTNNLIIQPGSSTKQFDSPSKVVSMQAFNKPAP